MKTFSFVAAVLMAASSLIASDCHNQVRVQLQAAPIVVQQPVLLQQQLAVYQAPVIAQQQFVMPYVQQQVVVPQVQQVVVPHVQQRIVVQQAPLLLQQHSVRQVAPLFQRGAVRGFLPQRSTQRIVVRSTVR